MEPKIKDFDDMWASYKEECVEDTNFSNYTSEDVKDDFYSGAFSVLCLLNSGVPIQEIAQQVERHLDDSDLLDRNN